MYCSPLTLENIQGTTLRLEIGFVFNLTDHILSCRHAKILLAPDLKMREKAASKQRVRLLPE